MSAGTRCSRRVLIVEDDRDVLDSIREVLEDNDYEAIAARNGREALEALHAAALKPCVILLDVMMPVMDGWGFRTSQQADADLNGIPVVVITAHARADQTALKMDAAAFLRKPIRLDALLSTVARYCETD